MTRARERLELVGAVPQDKLDKLGAGSDSEQARTWLDWIAPRFKDALGRCTVDGPALAVDRTAAGSCCCGAPEVSRMRRLSARRNPPPAQSAGPDEPLRQVLQRRLGLQYRYPAAARLPQKATVSALARHSPEADAAAALSSEHDAMPRPVTGPSRGQEQWPGAPRLAARSIACWRSWTSRPQ